MALTWDVFIESELKRSGSVSWMTVAMVLARRHATPGRLPDVRFYNGTAHKILHGFVERGVLVEGPENEKGETRYVRAPVSDTSVEQIPGGEHDELPDGDSPAA